MKRLLYIASVVVIGVVLGCGGGGGGGGGGNGNTGTTGTITNISFKVVFAGTQAPITMQSVATGNTLTLEMVGLNSSGNYVVLSGASFSSTAPSTVATLSGSTLKITGSSSGTTYSVAALYSGTSYTASFQSTGAMAHVSGSIRDEDNANVAGAEVDVYDNTGKVVGEAVSGTSGQFVANVPTSAVGFSADFTNLSATYYNQYFYNKLGYTITTGNCPTALPKLTLNQTTSLPYQIVAIPTSVGAPPPPDGC